MAGLIPRPFIDELLNRTDIVDLIDGYVPLKKRGTSYVACCPFHHEKTPSFNVVAKKQFYHCFGCGVSGNAISFVMNYLHQGFTEAIETLATRLGMTVPHEGQAHKKHASSSLYEFLQHIALFYQKNLQSENNPATLYLKKRNLNSHVIQLYQLGYAPKGWQTLETRFKQQKNALVNTGMLVQKDNGKTYDRYRQRLIFPIHDQHGRVVGFGGRAIETDQVPKYLNSPESVVFQKSRELYGLYQALQHAPLASILIVEGYMDVIALAQHGIYNAVATMGTSTSTYHIQILSKHTQKIIFCFDGDTAGKQAAWRALENALPNLNTGLDASFIFLPDGHDPDSLIRQEGQAAFLQRLQKATPLNQFFWDTLTVDLDHTNLAGKSQLVNAAKPYLIKMSDGPYKQLLIEELARLTRIDAHRIQQLLLEKTPQKNTHPNQTIIRSPMRIAIAILLQNPEIYAEHAAEISLDLLDDQKHRVLKTLMQQILENQTPNTALLIESWRETPLFDALTKLAAWDHQVPHHALPKEFIDTILFLVKQNQDVTIQTLLEKAHHQGLTTEERAHLQDLLKKRHQANSDSHTNLQN